MYDISNADYDHHNDHHNHKCIIIIIIIDEDYAYVNSNTYIQTVLSIYLILSISICANKYEEINKQNTHTPKLLQQKETITSINKGHKGKDGTVWRKLNILCIHLAVDMVR